MIGRLKGIIDGIETETILLDVHGVVYEIFAPVSTLRNMTLGAATTLVIETHVREDHIHLYGFESLAERQWFRTLNKVNGVGTKLALAILGALPGQKLSLALLSKDRQALLQVSGVGPKLADRLLTELKDVLPFDAGTLHVNSPNPGLPANPASDTNPVIEDAVLALTQLGYRRSDAYMAAMKMAASYTDIGEIIKGSLKELTGK